jgi:hypothetical protein
MEKEGEHAEALHRLGQSSTPNVPSKAAKGENGNSPRAHLSLRPRQSRVTAHPGDRKHADSNDIGTKYYMIPFVNQ